MTVQLYGFKQSYGGLSGDTKPVTTRGTTIPLGSTFRETDTGREFEWDGHRWALKAEDANIGNLLREVIAELQEMKTILVETKALQDAVVERF